MLESVSMCPVGGVFVSSLLLVFLMLKLVFVIRHGICYRLENWELQYSCHMQSIYIQGGANTTHVFQIIVTLFIFNIKKLC